MDVGPTGMNPTFSTYVAAVDNNGNYGGQFVASSASGLPTGRLVEKAAKRQAPRPLWLDAPYREPVQLRLPFDDGSKGEDESDAKGGEEAAKGQG